ncbi:MAG: GntR family transcriptional regulator [Muricomes sp.]
MEFKEIVTPSLTELFIKEIERMILSGELKIGEKLPTERELSEKMKVSRAVINGGLNKLASIGFLRIAPRKGVFVNDYIANGNVDVLTAIMEYNSWRFTPEYLEPILQFRTSIEPYAIELAVQNAQEGDLEKLSEIISRLKSGPSDFDAAELIFQFFHVISIAGKNIILPLLFRTFKPVYQSIGGVIVRLGQVEALIEDYEYLYQAILDRRGEDAWRRDLECIEKCRKNIGSHYKPGDYF